MADMVERSVSRRLKQISLRRALLGQKLTSSPKLEHYILNDLFRDCTRTDKRFGRAHERRVPGPKDRVERPLISPAEALQKVVAFQS
jgi:hypothetical protein